MLPNIEHLAEKNRALLDRLNFDPTVDNPDDLNNREVFADSGLFPEEAIDTIFMNSSVESRLADSIVPPNVGALLVRPDMVHASSEVEHFIADRFRIIFQDTVELDAHKYWDIYAPAIVGREVEATRLTRAAVYIGSPCRLMVFMNLVDEPPQATADEVYERYKGKQGVYEPGTLRGDVVFSQAIMANFHRLAEDTYHDPTLRQAIDPFGAYKKAVQVHGIGGDLPFPILRFTGVGVHVPDYNEIHSDLEVLTDNVTHRRIARLRDANTISVR